MDQNGNQNVGNESNQPLFPVNGVVHAEPLPPAVANAGPLPEAVAHAVPHFPNPPIPPHFRTALLELLTSEGVNDIATRERITEAVIESVTYRYPSLHENMFQQMEVYNIFQALYNHMQDPNMRVSLIDIILQDQMVNGLSEEVILEILWAEIFFQYPWCRGEDNFCCICQCTFEEGEVISKLDCNDAHRYHYLCIKEWLMHKNTCPLCNQMGLYTCLDRQQRWPSL